MQGAALIPASMDSAILVAIAVNKIDMESYVPQDSQEIFNGFRTGQMKFHCQVSNPLHRFGIFKNILFSPLASLTSINQQIHYLRSGESLRKLP